MGAGWAQDEVARAINQVMGKERKDERQPSERLKESSSLYGTVAAWLDLSEVDEPLRLKLLQHILHEAITRGAADSSNVRSAGELLGFTRYSADEIDMILSKEPSSTELPHRGRDRQVLWKPVRLLLAGTHQSPPIKIRRARDKQEQWADAAADALYHYLQHLRTSPAEIEKIKSEILLLKAEDASSGSPPESDTDKRSLKRRLTFAIAAAAVVATVIASAIFVNLLTTARGGDPKGSETWAANAQELERRYDGKDPRGHNGTESKCADPPNSEPVTSSEPPVFGPEGTIIGEIHLRTSPVCPVIWGRVLWGGTPDGTYRIPDGWTLHVVSHRPDTSARYELTEPSRATPVPYGLGPMLTTARGCVYVEAYFSKGEERTVPASTSCAKQ